MCSERLHTSAGAGAALVQAVVRVSAPCYRWRQAGGGGQQWACQPSAPATAIATTPLCTPESLQARRNHSPAARVSGPDTPQLTVAPPRSRPVQQALDQACRACRAACWPTPPRLPPSCRTLCTSAALQHGAADACCRCHCHAQLCVAASAPPAPPCRRQCRFRRQCRPDISKAAALPLLQHSFHWSR